MGISKEDDDWNWESGEDDKDAQRCDEEVEEVIHPTSAAGGSAKSILLFAGEKRGQHWLCCDLLSLKNLVWVKLRDYVISRANPIPILMFLVRVVMIW